MATITFKDASRRNSSTAGINVIDLNFTDGDMIVAIVNFEGASPPDDILILDEDIAFSKDYQRLDSVNGFGVAIYSLGNLLGDLTLATVRAEWSVNVDYCTLSVYTVDGNYSVDADVCARNLDAATSAPSSGSTTEHKDRDSIAFGCFCAQGPETDVSLTPSAGWTSGNKKGTTNTTATLNVTGTNVYQSLAFADPISAAGTGATARDWATLCVVYRPIPEVATDKNGTAIFTGKTVKYSGSRYDVVSIDYYRNVVNLTTVGYVGASEVELV